MVVCGRRYFLALTNTPNIKDYINKMRLRDEELSKGYG